MSELKRNAVPAIRTSLEVGFVDGRLPEKYVPLRGRVTRTIGAVRAFPFEDAQFEVVLMNAPAVCNEAVREAHRVLRPSGRLYFTVLEKSGSSPTGMTSREVYSMLRHGFNLIGVEETPWWKFWVSTRTLSFCAEKKNWRQLEHAYRPLV